MKLILYSLIPVLLACCNGKRTDSENKFQPVELKSQITHVQPMTGIVLWNNHPENNTNAISLEYTYLTYRDIVKGKDNYDWTYLDKILDDVVSRGHHAIVRFRYVYVGDAEGGVPDYIKARPDYKDTLGISEGKPTRFPDWRCTELQHFHLQFYKKLAERYDNDKRLAFLQTGFGLWAEYHIYDGPRIIGQTFPSKEFQATFFRTMGELFKNLPWSVSIDAANEEYTPMAAQPDLKNIQFGLFDDSFMHESHHLYNTDCWNFFSRDRYQTSPAGGEFGYYTKYDQEHVLDTAGIHGRNFEHQAKAFHITYMIGNNQPKYQTMERIKETSMACGYRFKITSLSTSRDSSKIQIENTGVAPIYRDAYITVNGVRSSQSLRTLQPGNTAWYSVASGGEKPTVTIECDHLLEGQQIEFEANISPEQSSKE